MSDDFADLVEQHRGTLHRFLRREVGRVLLRFETVDDLVQGVQLKMIAAAESFERRTDEEFRAWMFTVARHFLQQRREYWFALKRAGGPLLRLSLTGADGEHTPLPIPSRDSGPATLADRREALLRAVRALDLLGERDRELVQASVSGLDRHQLGNRFGLSPEAAERARLRAYERLRKTFRLLSRAREAPPS